VRKKIAGWVLAVTAAGLAGQAHADHAVGDAAPGAQAEQPLSGMEILMLAQSAAGGPVWISPQSLTLSGRAIFYAEQGAEPRAVADNYRMWREFDQNRTAAHTAQGKVRIRALTGKEVMFEVGFDGDTTWNEKGVIPKEQADAYWANSFGFGIIRQAGKPGFSAKRRADDQVAGFPAFMVELRDPGGSVTLFGVDRKDFKIRLVGFTTPKGWHHRIYRDFIRLEPSGWVQPRHVSLYYNGRKSNEVFWKDVAINEPIDPSVFTQPQPKLTPVQSAE